MESVGKDPVPAGREGWLLTQGVSREAGQAARFATYRRHGPPRLVSFQPCRGHPGSWPQPWEGRAPLGKSQPPGTLL